jgi:hypothetical protein
MARSVGRGLRLWRDGERLERVFLAEVARLAPEGRVAEATGAVLVPGFLGLVLGPLLVAGTASMIGLGAAYAILGAVTLAATLVLVAGRKK